jgi:MSHA biogenesis protein MshO
MRLDPLHRHPRRQAGVTLIELAIVIALVGILGAIIMQFIMPVRSYIDTTRRAALTDAADTALRRIGRDLRLALPNSVRVNDPDNTFVEFLLVRTGGRYRVDTDSSATNTCTGGFAADVLSFSAADTCFKTIGNIPNLGNIVASDYVVIFNLPPGTPSANAYEFTDTGGNKSQVSTTLPVALTGEDRITITSHTFTYESPGNRFFIIEGPVSYGCAGGVLRRYWGYTIPSTQSAPPSGGTSAVIATGVASCSFLYDTSLSAQGAGLISMNLRLSMQDSRGSTETISLYHAVHVNNVP